MLAYFLQLILYIQNKPDRQLKGNIFSFIVIAIAAAEASKIVNDNSQIK